MKIKKDLNDSELAREKISKTNDRYLKELQSMKEKHQILSLSKVNEDLSITLNED